MDEQYALERIFCDVLEQHVKADGWEVVREAPVPGGRIDLLCARGAERWVIEAKREASRQDVRRSLGQLLFYGYYHPEARLSFASPSLPGRDLVDMLDQHHISTLRIRSMLEVQEHAACIEQIPAAMLDTDFASFGQWWTTCEAADWTCTRCDFYGFDFPAVYCAVPSQGVGGVVVQYPEWVDARWSIRHYCERCGYDNWAAKEFLYIDDRQVAYMQRTVGPWQPLAGRSVAYRSRTVAP